MRLINLILVLCGCLMQAAATAQPTAEFKCYSLPTVLLKTLENDSLEVMQVDSAGALPADSLFGNIPALYRNLVTDKFTGDSFYVYFFYKKHTERLLYHLLTHEQSASDSSLILPFYTLDLVGFLMGPGTEQAGRLLKDISALPYTTRTQFELVAADADNSKWLEPGSPPVVKRKKKTTRTKNRS